MIGFSTFVIVMLLNVILLAEPEPPWKKKADNGKSIHVSLVMYGIKRGIVYVICISNTGTVFILTPFCVSVKVQPSTLMLPTTSVAPFLPKLPTLSRRKKKDDQDTHVGKQFVLWLKVVQTYIPYAMTRATI